MNVENLKTGVQPGNPHRPSDDGFLYKNMFDYILFLNIFRRSIQFFFNTKKNKTGMEFYNNKPNSFIFFFLFVCRLLDKYNSCRERNKFFP
jgi:hypothetical protein